MGGVLDHGKFCVVVLVVCYVVGVANSATDPNDLKILIDFKKGLKNPELLKWPEGSQDPCGPPPWPHVFCSGDRVAQIQVQNLGLTGPLPQNFNQLKKLYNLGFQRNKFYGKLPSFSGLSELEFAYLNDNEFDTIPFDFFDGLTNLRVLALDSNPLNKTTGWSIPDSLKNSAQLQNLSLINCNLVGPVPDFLGTLPSLSVLMLSYNKLSGKIPASFGQSLMQILWLNDQADGGMTGPINVVSKMVSLVQLWLHGNQFTGTIPEDIGALSSLKDLNLNGNRLVGFIPKSLANMELNNLVLNNNLLMGPIPNFKAGNVTYVFNSFCQTERGIECARDVYALLDFLAAVNYPVNLVSRWSGNEPCQGPWLGLICTSNAKVSLLNLPGHNLSGTLSPSISILDSLIEIRLGKNSINGVIPKNFTELKSLRLLDISDNNIQPPLPEFHDGVKLVIDGNPLLLTNHTMAPTSPVSSPPPAGSQTPSNQTSPDRTQPPSSDRSPHSPITPPSSNPSSSSNQVQPPPKSTFPVLVVVVGMAVVIVVLLAVLPSVYCCKKRKDTSDALGSIMFHPKDPSDPQNMVKVTVSNNTPRSLSSQVAVSSGSISGATENSHLIESGNLVISVQVLRKATKNFSKETELGRGGFGTVYEGELEDGTKIAVKRMEAGMTTSKALDEFQSEIAVLSKVRHRHLVSLLGHSIEGNERLLVYEYMPHGALNRHLFQWKTLQLKPLPWKTRLSIALDVARGMEYLHGLARQTFIHRDLKSSNILLDDEFRAKISDFGLVKLAPDGEKSVVTRLAGTFGYLAPEYAVMGKITTKSDVFSYGVVLMELLTGLAALDEGRSEENRYLAEWFWRMKSSKEKLKAAIDPALEADDETFESISIVAELAVVCSAREPDHRPDMGHVVNVLSPLVQIWKPITDESDCYHGVDYNLPLPQMLKGWQQAESEDISYSSLENSKGSIPTRPIGFAESFTSSDAR